jgi:hypothetical protein
VRRYRAAHLAGIETAPVRIVESTNSQALIWSDPVNSISVPVITKVAAFASDFSPLLPTEQITIPDDLR